MRCEDMILLYNIINRIVIIVISYCLWSILTIVFLSGCNGNIPPASDIVSSKVTLSWNEVPGAISYNIYASTSPGVTKLIGFKIRSTKLNPLACLLSSSNKRNSISELIHKEFRK